MVNQLKENILKARPYQNEALFAISNFVKELLRGTLELRKDVIFKNSALLNMATGSGKTFTIGTALNNIIKLRDRFDSIYKRKEFENLNIIVLTHRIDLVNQFRDDLVFGRDDKHPIMDDSILDSLHISTYHSKADKEDNFIDNEEIDLGEGSKKDNIIFSTQQTAGLKGLVNKLDYIDIILIDESHNVKLDSDYYDVLKELATKTRLGDEALILPVTATPNNETRELFGQEIFDYGLEKYLNSEYSPNVQYNLVTNSNADEKLIKQLSDIVEESKHTEDFKIKKELIKKAEELFIEIMTSFVDNETLVDDLFERVGENGILEETVIFVDSIESADKLAEIINNKSGIDGFALSFHSKNDSNDAIGKLRDKNNPCKIILSIGKLNEGIDLPKVKNVVFWRGTDSETIFFQQFGRGLRGNDLVRYFDYVGGIKNFAWINDIFVKYNKIAGENESSGSGDSSERKFNLLGSNIGTNHHNIDLVNIGLGITNTKNELNVSKEEIIEYFKTIKGKVEESFNYLIKLSQKEIQEIEFKGNKMGKIKSILGWNSFNNLNIINPLGFSEYLYWLFGKDFDILSSEKIKEYFQTIKGGKEESYNYWDNLKQKEIQKIEFKGNKIRKIVKLSNWDNANKLDVAKVIGFKEFINWVFEKESNTLTFKKIKEYFKSIEGNEEDSYDYWINFNQKDIDIINYKGYKIRNIGTLCNYQNTEKIRNVLGFKGFINWVFEKESDTLTFKKIKEYFKSIEGSEEDSYNYWYNLKQKEIREIKYKGYTIKKIGGLCNYQNIEKIIYLSGFKEFINWIFEGSFENNYDKKIKEYFKTIKGNEEDSYNYWYNLKKKEIPGIEFKGNKIKKIIQLSGWDNYHNIKNAVTSTQFKEFINWIFNK